MNIVLLSGGSGKRLWPLSNDIRSKQFIKIFKTADGAYESMVQRVYRQINAGGYGCHRDHRHQQDPGVVPSTTSWVSTVGVCVEPCRRDTFPAIALATAYLHGCAGRLPGRSLSSSARWTPMWRTTTSRLSRSCLTQADKGEANLVLMGIEPTYPSEKYGYIIPRKVLSYVSQVRYLQGEARRRTRRSSILPRAHCGTAASLPTNWATCWTRPMS